MASVSPSWTMRPRAKEASSAASGGVSSSMRRAISACGVTSMSSSAKSMPASSRAISSTSACLTGATRRLSAPPIWLAAWRAWVSVCASIRSRTASAWVRSSLPERKARCVNSPGSARRAPSSSARRSSRLQHHRRAVRGNLHQILGGVGVGRGKEGDHGLVDAARHRLAFFVEHIGQPRARVLQRLAQANKLRGNRRGLRPAQTHNADAAAPRRRGDGGDGVGGRARGSHGLKSV